MKEIILKVLFNGSCFHTLYFFNQGFKVEEWLVHNIVLASGMHVSYYFSS